MEKNTTLNTINNTTATLPTNEVRKPQILIQTETYVNALTASLNEMDLKFTDYQKICVINILQKMKEMLNKEGLNFKDINQDNISQILQMVSMLQVNVSASPRECYLQFRNSKDQKGNWQKSFELGIEGDGNDKILRTFGVGVKEVKGAFIVREGDEFTLPSFDGEKIVPPTWKPKTYHNKPIMAFYIVIKTDGTKEFLISDREGVAKNLQAHIMNNSMKLDDKDRKELMSTIENMKLDEMLNDNSLRKFISPAWYAPQSREEMIVRKMRNNATKKYPKDFQSAFVESAYENTFEDYEQYRQPKEIVENDPIRVVENDYAEETNTELVNSPIVERMEEKTTPIVEESKEEVKSVENQGVVEEELPY